VQDLAMKIRQIDDIEIYQTDGADSRGGEIKRHRRAKPTGAHKQHSGAFERALPALANLRQEQVAAVPHQLFVSQIDRVTPPFRIHDSILGGENRSLWTLTIVSVASNALTSSFAHDAL